MECIKTPTVLNAWTVTDLLSSFKAGTLPPLILSAITAGKLIFANDTLKVKVVTNTYTAKPTQTLLKDAKGVFHLILTTTFDATYSEFIQ